MKQIIITIHFCSEGLLHTNQDKNDTGSLDIRIGHARIQNCTPYSQCVQIGMHALVACSVSSMVSVVLLISIFLYFRF